MKMMTSHIHYAALVLCSVVLVLSLTPGSAARIRSHADYIRQRTDLEMLVDGLRMQERVTKVWI